ncbi:MAG: tRNA (adenosine(37)-N6)-threonylcarbamoyltransferase complex ATPase subunit type 1 TsaE [Christensenellales bacterium]
MNYNGYEVYTTGAEETMLLAEDFSKSVQAGDIVLLKGDLGAGKTVFSKGFAKGLGVTSEVVSPTFTIVNCYDNKLNHFDLYRINSEAELMNIGAEEMLFDDKISLVEWPERVDRSYFGDNVWMVEIIKIDNDIRKITINKG